MSLIKFRPKTQDVFPSIFNEEMLFSPLFPASAFNRTGENWFPRIDVSEEPQHYSIEADLPGIRKEDVQLSFNDGILTIEGERKVESETKDKNYHCVERSYGKFVRSINIGTSVDASGIKANYKDGVLKVIVPKSERAKPKTSDIQAG